MRRLMLRGGGHRKDENAVPKDDKYVIINGK
jgi:hypothetical protein